VAAAIAAETAQRGLERLPVEQFRALPGLGASGIVGGMKVVVGNRGMMAESGIDSAMLESRAAELADQGRTTVFAAVDGKLVGLLAVADTIRPSSGAAIVQLQSLGLDLVLVSGDNRRTTDAVARQAGIERALAEVLPEGKVAEVRRLQGMGRVVAMVGDGINDAPALAAADIGVAMGGGTDIAAEAGDVVLMRDDLGLVATAIGLSRQTRRIMRQNLFWAFVYNTIGIPVAAGVLYPSFGIRLSPVLASAAMALSSVSVVTNSLRLRRFNQRLRSGGTA
jgi:Cu+-exporting ATPase